MKADFRHLMILSSTMVVLGCTSLDEQAWNKHTRQDPNALTVPKKWMLQSYVYNGKERITKGQGAWVAFGPNNSFGSFNGVNSTGHPAGEPAYEATADGGFRMITENQITTAVGIANIGGIAKANERREDIDRRGQLLRGATTFECTENTLILSDGTESNQLRYLARMR
jgi:hypothetical protein